MKQLAINLLKLALVWCIAVFLIASCGRSAYAVDLSKSLSVTPERHSGFFVPLNCIGSQSLHLNSASITAMQTRLHSLYEGMTQQNKSAMANMLGGTCMPRVNPLTSFKHGENLKNSKI